MSFIHADQNSEANNIRHLINRHLRHKLFINLHKPGQKSNHQMHKTDRLHYRLSATCITQKAQPIKVFIKVYLQLRGQIKTDTSLLAAILAARQIKFETNCNRNPLRDIIDQVERK
jgi:hypothetical protein